tara:strand:+ start:326 stop:652 length:327 start_codon:yes stop_codon:yes gene_type:complete
MLYYEDEYISYVIYINNEKLVKGLAIIKKNYKPYLHFHKEEEYYNLLSGKAKLYINGNITIIEAPYEIKIKSNNVHALRPISNNVVLEFIFEKGPFENIKYTYLKSRL